MSLRESPLLYLFVDVSSIERARTFFEQTLGIPVIENQFHPPHEYHGIVKYDAGPTILSLNLGSERRFQRPGSDGLATVFSVPEGRGSVPEGMGTVEITPANAWADGHGERILTDVDGHHYVLRERSPGDGRRHPQAATIMEHWLAVRDLNSSVHYYGTLLDLALIERTETTARFATGSVDLVLHARDAAFDGRPVFTDSYLLVFYTPDVQAAFDALDGRGLPFRTRVGFSDIGGTARFSDPSGNIFCLYQPSEEALTWGSGARVRELTTIRSCAPVGVAAQHALPPLMRLDYHP